MSVQLLAPRRTLEPQRPEAREVAFPGGAALCCAVLLGAVFWVALALLVLA